MPCQCPERDEYILGRFSNSNISLHKSCSVEHPYVPHESVTSPIIMYVYLCDSHFPLTASHLSNRLLCFKVPLYRVILCYLRRMLTIVRETQ